MKMMRKLIKINPILCRVLISIQIFALPDCILENSGSQKRLGVEIEGKLNFNEHVTNLSNKVSRKIQVFAYFFHIYLKHKNDF